MDELVRSTRGKTRTTTYDHDSFELASKVVPVALAQTTFQNIMNICGFALISTQQIVFLLIFTFHQIQLHSIPINRMFVQSEGALGIWALISIQSSLYTIFILSGPSLAQPHFGPAERLSFELASC